MNNKKEKNVSYKKPPIIGCSIRIQYCVTLYHVYNNFFHLFIQFFLFRLAPALSKAVGFRTYYFAEVFNDVKWGLFVNVVKFWEVLNIFFLFQQLNPFYFLCTNFVISQLKKKNRIESPTVQSLKNSFTSGISFSVIEGIINCCLFF